MFAGRLVGPSDQALGRLTVEPRGLQLVGVAVLHGPAPFSGAIRARQVARATARATQLARLAVLLESCDLSFVLLDKLFLVRDALLARGVLASSIGFELGRIVLELGSPVRVLLVLLRFALSFGEDDDGSTGLRVDDGLHDFSFLLS